MRCEIKKTTQKMACFSHSDDYFKLSEVASEFPTIHEIQLKSQEHYNELMKVLEAEPNSIPIFVKDTKGEIHIMPADHNSIKIAPDDQLAYLGKALKKAS